MQCRPGRPSGRPFEIRFESVPLYQPPLKVPCSTVIIPGGHYALGRLFLGSVQLPFGADLEYWDMHAYERHWRSATERVVGPWGEASLLTSYWGPDARHQAAWGASREGDHVTFVGGWIAGGDPTALADPVRAAGARTTWTPVRDEPDGQTSWEVPVAALQEFLEHGRTAAV